MLASSYFKDVNPVKKNYGYMGNTAESLQSWEKRAG